jgi:hypothetical protein
MTSKKHTGLTCYDEDCQVYRAPPRPTTPGAAWTTSGQFLTYNGEPIIATIPPATAGPLKAAKTCGRTPCPTCGVSMTPTRRTSRHRSRLQLDGDYTSEQITSACAPEATLRTIVLMRGRIHPTETCIRLPRILTRQVVVTKAEHPVALGRQLHPLTITARTYGNFLYQRGTTSITAAAVQLRHRRQRIARNSSDSPTSTHHRVGEVKAVGDTRDDAGCFR